MIAEWKERIVGWLVVAFWVGVLSFGYGLLLASTMNGGIEW